MSREDQLLRLVMRLQHEQDPATIQRHLLAYIRKVSGAQVVALFMLHQHELILHSYSGRRFTSSTRQTSSRRRVNYKRISAKGLFGSALHTHGMMCISAPYHDQRILEAERCWIHEDGYVLLSAVQGSSTIGDRQGVLVLSFSTRDSLPEQREQDWQCHPDLPVCILLLGAFLDDKQVNLAASVQHKQPAIETFSLAGNIPVGASDFKNIVDQERRRIARDIHDDIAQRMVHALYKLELVQRLLEQQQFAMAYTEVQHAYTHITKSLQRLRQYILSLRPAELEGYSLAAELPLLLDEYRVNYPEVTLLCTCSQFGQVPSHLEATAFRFFQETLSNAYKHARATCITLSMSADDNALSLEVRDNGRGFQLDLLPRRISTHIGLRALQERASEMGGYIDIQSEPDLGTHIKAVFPMSASPVIPSQEQGPGAMRK